MIDRGAASSAKEKGKGPLKDRLLFAVNEAALCHLLSIGRRTGLIECLSSGTAATADDIAQATSLAPRHVHAWLDAMTAAEIVDYDEDTRRFTLSPEYVAQLRATNGSDDILDLLHTIGLIGSIEDDIVDGLRGKQTPPIESCLHLFDVMTDDDARSAAASIESRILPLVPGLKRELQRGIRVLIVGCGKSPLAELAETFPRSTFVGLDRSQEALRDAHAKAYRKNLANVEVVPADMRTFDRDAEPDIFDFAAMFTPIADTDAPAALLRGVQRSLRQGGVFLLCDVGGTGDPVIDRGHRIGTLLYTFACVRSLTSDERESLDGTCANRGSIRMEFELERAGFNAIEVRSIDDSPHKNWFVARK